MKISEAAAVQDLDMAIMSIGLALENAGHHATDYYHPIAQAELADLTDQQKAELSARIQHRAKQ